MKDKVTSNIAKRHLDPVIAYVRDNRGALIEIHRRLNQRTRKKWHLRNVFGWLHSDANKRTQPLLGVGLLLKEIGTELMAEQKPVETENGH